MSCEISKIVICDSKWETSTWFPMRVIKVKRRIADSAYWASRREVLPFSPFFTKYSRVIEIRGQSRQLRMRERMHSFNACHIKDTSEQFQKDLKRKSSSHTPSHPGARYWQTRREEEIGGVKGEIWAGGWIVGSALVYTDITMYYGI